MLLGIGFQALGGYARSFFQTSNYTRRHTLDGGPEEALCNKLVAAAAAVAIVIGCGFQPNRADDLI